MNGLNNNIKYGHYKVFNDDDFFTTIIHNDIKLFSYEKFLKFSLEYMEMKIKKICILKENNYSISNLID